MEPLQRPSGPQEFSRTPIMPLDPLDPLDPLNPLGPVQQPDQSGRHRIPAQTRASAPQIPTPQPPAPSVARPADAEPDLDEESSDAEPYSVSTMVVPSAFVNAGAYSQAWGGAGQNGANSPFAGLPGLSGSPGWGGGPDQAASEEPAPQAEVALLASPGSRLLAKIIDFFLALLMSSPATATLLLVAHRHDHQYVEALRLKATTTYTTLGMDGTGIALWALAAIILVLFALLYEAFRVGAGGQTTGRRLLGIRVVRASGGRFSTGSALVRGTLFWLFLAVPVIDVLALGPIAWGRPYRQGLHDKITRAVTVKTG